MVQFFWSFLLGIFVRTTFEFGRISALLLTIGVAVMFANWFLGRRLFFASPKPNTTKHKKFQKIRFSDYIKFILYVVFGGLVSYASVFFNNQNFYNKVNFDINIQNLAKTVISSGNFLQNTADDSGVPDVVFPKGNNYKSQDHNILSEKSSQDPIVLSYYSGKVYTNFVGDVNVLAQDKSDRFVVEDVRGRKFLLYSKSSLHVGGEYLLYDRVAILAEIQDKLNREFHNYADPKKLKYDFFYSSGLSVGSVDIDFKDQDIVSEISGIRNYEFDFDNRMRMKGFYGVFYNPNMTENLGYKPNNSMIDNIRQKLVDSVQSVYSSTKNAGLYLGMLIGDKKLIDSYSYADFINSGIVHMVAVSGGNIVMVLIFLGFVFRWIPFYLRLVVLGAGIIIYVMICGNDSSIIRAGIMGILSLFTLMLGREINIRRSLAYTVFVMLMRNPYLLVRDIGFLLSFGAVVGLVRAGARKTIEYKTIKKGLTMSKKTKIRVRNLFIDFIKNYIYPTVGATLGTLPFILFFMTKINLLGIVGNLAVLPTIPLIMIYGFLSPILAKISYIFVQIGFWITDYVFRVSKFSSDHGVYMLLGTNRIRWFVLLLGVVSMLRFAMKTSKPDLKNVKK